MRSTTLAKILPASSRSASLFAPLAFCTNERHKITADVDCGPAPRCYARYQQHGIRDGSDTKEVGYRPGRRDSSHHGDGFWSEQLRDFLSHRRWHVRQRAADCLGKSVFGAE